MTSLVNISSVLVVSECIVGGEEDKLAAAQMLRDYQVARKQDAYDRIPVVSTTAGEGS